MRCFEIQSQSATISSEAFPSGANSVTPNPAPSASWWSLRCAIKGSASTPREFNDVAASLSRPPRVGVWLRIKANRRVEPANGDQRRYCCLDIGRAGTRRDQTKIGLGDGTHRQGVVRGSRVDDCEPYPAGLEARYHRIDIGRIGNAIDVRIGIRSPLFPFRDGSLRIRLNESDTLSMRHRGHCKSRRQRALTASAFLRDQSKDVHIQRSPQLAATRNSHAVGNKCSAMHNATCGFPQQHTEIKNTASRRRRSGRSARRRCRAHSSGTAAMAASSLASASWRPSAAHNPR